MKPDIKSYTSKKVEKGLPSKIHGRGLFATKAILKDEVVAKKTGYLLTRAEFEIIKPKGHIELQIAQDLFLAPKEDDDFEKNMIFINHSCDPNVGMCGDRQFVAMRNIQPGEELTIDYAMIDDSDYVMSCNCNSSNCRRRITGHDWKREDLQKKYKGYFSSYLKENM